jgi:hypothetical protein
MQGSSIQWKKGQEIGMVKQCWQSVRQDIVCVSVLLSVPAQPVIALETHTLELLSENHPPCIVFFKG